MLRFVQHDRKRSGSRARGAGFVQIILVLVVILTMTVIALKMYQRSVPNLPARGGHPARAVLDQMELRVEGLSSQTDALVVTQELQRVPGVAGANVEYPGGIARVTFQPARVTRAQLVAAIERAGFQAAP